MSHRCPEASVRFDDESREYAFVHRETVLRVGNDAGAIEDIRLFGSSLEKDGGWKVFSYVVDD